MNGRGLVIARGAGCRRVPAGGGAGGGSPHVSARVEVQRLKDGKGEGLPPKSAHHAPQSTLKRTFAEPCGGPRHAD